MSRFKRGDQARASQSEDRESESPAHGSGLRAFVCPILREYAIRVYPRSSGPLSVGTSTRGLERASTQKDR